LLQVAVLDVEVDIVVVEVVDIVELDVGVVDSFALDVGNKQLV
jgi:hypothetical protein